jgi:hypothetical protein|uniref:Uncharacterized protein n=1 Tax=Myoviridae sp. ctPuP5 TaxID=2823543 RepID=A0A8S5L9R6_9CAUD|nr:MAG TPA: hypothetical protein [Myoviridae sp. ctPuP5]
MKYKNIIISLLKGYYEEFSPNRLLAPISDDCHTLVELQIPIKGVKRIILCDLKYNTVHVYFEELGDDIEISKFVPEYQKAIYDSFYEYFIKPFN